MIPVLREVGVLTAIFVTAYLLGLYATRIEPPWLLGVAMALLGLTASHLLHTKWADR